MRARAAFLVGAAAASAALGQAARAEFEIPQVDVETIEIEYRGAPHWGLPQPEDDGEVDALRQSHELELQYGITDRWAVRATPNLEQPEGDHLDLASIGLETQVVLFPRKGGAFGLAVVGGYSPDSFFADLDEPDELEIGPIIEVAGGPLVATLNLNLFREVGSASEQNWFGLEYASQVELRLGKRWSLAALMFGEIEDLSAPGGFSAQTHLLGPGAYLYSDGQDEPEGAGEEERWQWSLGLGALFGLTPESTDATIRIVFAVER